MTNEMNTHRVTLPWMNLIREWKVEGWPAEQVVNALFDYGLKEESRITKQMAHISGSGTVVAQQKGSDELGEKDE